MLALGGAAALLGSALFILWKTYFGRGRERRWDGSGEGWWGAEPARLPEWDEWDVSAGPGHLRANGGAGGRRPQSPGGQRGPSWPPDPRDGWAFGFGEGGAASPPAGWGPRRPGACAVRAAQRRGAGGSPPAARFPAAVVPSTRDGGLRNLREAPQGKPAERGRGFGIPTVTLVAWPRAAPACPWGRERGWAPRGRRSAPGRAGG